LQLLISARADIEATDESGKRPLQYATLSGTEQVVAALTESGAAVNACDTLVRRTALHLAAMRSHMQVMRYLINHDADVNMTDMDGTSVLHFATLNSNDDMVNLLIEARAQIGASDQHGMTPLHDAALASSDSGVLPIRSLIEASAQVGQTDMFGRTALHFAAGMDHEAVVACLIAYGANVNSTDDINGWTALHWAADKGYEGIAHCLLKCGAKLDLKDKFGKTAAFYADDGGHTLLAAELRPNIS